MKSPESDTPGVLLARFDEFIESASRLESSHRQLQEEVVRLRRELEDRNRELERSLNEVETTKRVLFRILEALPCGVVLLDTMGSHIFLANPEAQKLLWGGGESQTVLPAPLQQVVRRAMIAPRDTAAEEEVLHDAVTPARWLSVRATRVAFFAARPELGNHILIIQDITGQKELEQERERVRNSMALAEISSILAHEIRNPLGSMELFLSLLRTQASLSPEAASWTDHLTAGVRNLSATVNNVLNFYTSGSFAMAPFEMAPMLEDCTSFLEPMAQESGHQLVLMGNCDEALVNGDPQALRQVIQNLCSNALRHSPVGGCVTISSHRAGDKIQIEIGDQGSGIAPEFLPHIFDAGFSGNRRSSGLGLAVCRRIVEAHGGAIGVRNTSSEGTTMYVEIPAL